MGPFKYENLQKPTHPTWKKVANYLLYVLLPALNIFFVAMQATGVFDIKLSFYGVAGTNLLIALFKGATKFTTEPQP
jgi:hypothetical protein